MLKGPLLEAKFSFLRDDILLIAQVEVESGRQILRMQKIDPATGKVLLEDTLDCIHAAICDIPAGQFEEVSKGLNFEKKNFTDPLK